MVPAILANSYRNVTKSGRPGKNRYRNRCQAFATRLRDNAGKTCHPCCLWCAAHKKNKFESTLHPMLPGSRWNLNFKSRLGWVVKQDQHQGSPNSSRFLSSEGHATS